MLVAGSGGQLGRALADCVPAGATLVAPPEAGFDITDRARVAQVVAASGADILVNAAAYTAVDRAEQEPERAMLLNGAAPGWLAEAAVAAGLRFVHVSTDFVFDGCAHLPYPPDAVPNPIGTYGATKLAGEQAVRAADPQALILRTAWVYASGGNNFVATMLRLMTTRDEVRVVSDQVGTPTHAASLARAIWALAARGSTGTLHWTDAGVASWYDFAVAIQEEALARGLIDRAVPVVPIATEDYPTPAKRPHWSVLDKRATFALIGQARHWRVELRDALSGMRTTAP